MSTGTNPQIERARGCLLGQLAGDSLGSLVEFQSPEKIRQEYPDGLRDLADGGAWNTLAGQPTDDSEMALMLARTLLEKGHYDQDATRQAYLFWLNSRPFDCGNTVASGLGGRPKADSQANGAMMRLSPLGIFGARHDLDEVAQWAREDARITHPHPVCQDSNALFAMAIAHAVRTGPEPQELYDLIREWARDMKVDSALMDVIEGAAQSPPQDYVASQGWVFIAFRNALWQLLHGANLEEALIDTVMRGGDTDTNAAICGALLGAVHGQGAVPRRWTDTILNCRPESGRPNVHRPRLSCFWPVDALDLAAALLM